MDKDIKTIISLLDIMDFKILIKVMEESMQAYKKNPSEENRKNFLFDTTMLILKEMLDVKGFNYILKHWDSFPGVFDDFNKN